jgi:hypothetical protein
VGLTQKRLLTIKLLRDKMLVVGQTTCCFGDMLVAQQHFGCTTKCWLCDKMLVARQHLGCTTAFWLCDKMLVARQNVGCATKCWLRDPIMQKSFSFCSLVKMSGRDKKMLLYKENCPFFLPT